MSFFNCSGPTFFGPPCSLMFVYITIDACAIAAIVPELKMGDDSFVDGQVSYCSISWYF